MKSTHPSYKLKQYEFPTKISQDDIEMLQSMKLEGKSIHDARYWLMKRYWNNEEQKLSVDSRTIENWLKKHFA
jgi:SOS response regulatory protein OraA/RecX